MSPAGSGYNRVASDVKTRKELEPKLSNPLPYDSLTAHHLYSFGTIGLGRFWQRLWRPREIEKHTIGTLLEPGRYSKLTQRL